MKKAIWRAIIEVGFVVFLFYSNLLMGEFERSGKGQEIGLAWAIGDIFTPANFGIAVNRPRSSATSSLNFSGSKF
jgi:hypothetical protein